MRDPYDIAVAFDDLVGEEPEALGESLVDRLARWVDAAKWRAAGRRGGDARVDDDRSYRAHRMERVFHRMSEGGPTVLGESIPLPCCTGGAIECWQDGEDVVCTVRFVSPKGPRMATASMPLAPVVDDVIGSAWLTGVGYDEVAAYAGPLSAAVAADKLVQDVCCIVVGYLDNPRKSEARDHSVASNQYLFGCDMLASLYGGA